MARIPIVAGNWKMNKSPVQATAFVHELIPLLAPLTEAERVLCPPFISIPSVHAAVQGTSIKVGAQNVHTELHGAYTGSISVTMLKELVEYVIVGHSEVREYLGETDVVINSKIQLLLNHGLKPILAVGESLSQFEAGLTESFVVGQLKAALEGIPMDEIHKIVIAYEPIWAIGSGRTATGAQANDIIGLIRFTVGQLYGTAIADQVRIQYGGSVKPNNMREFMRQPEIDGALVGGASLHSGDFVELTRIAIEATHEKAAEAR